ncbi:hypothetical protein [Streptomyces sp. NPDC059072]
MTNTTAFDWQPLPFKWSGEWWESRPGDGALSEEDEAVRRAQ